MDYKENSHSRAISTKELILENDFVFQVWCHPPVIFIRNLAKIFHLETHDLSTTLLSFLVYDRKENFTNM
jgi:hypothetical protein